MWGLLYGSMGFELRVSELYLHYLRTISILGGLVVKVSTAKFWGTLALRELCKDEIVGIMCAFLQDYMGTCVKDPITTKSPLCHGREHKNHLLKIFVTRTAGSVTKIRTQYSRRIRP